MFQLAELATQSVFLGPLANLCEVLCALGQQVFAVLHEALRIMKSRGHAFLRHRDPHRVALLSASFLFADFSRASRTVSAPKRSQKIAPNYQYPRASTNN